MTYSPTNPGSLTHSRRHHYRLSTMPHLLYFYTPHIRMLVCFWGCLLISQNGGRATQAKHAILNSTLLHTKFHLNGEVGKVWCLYRDGWRVQNKELSTIARVLYTSKTTYCHYIDFLLLSFSFKIYPRSCSAKCLVCWSIIVLVSVIEFPLVV